MNSPHQHPRSTQLLTLPDDCIRLILERTPLEDQFRLRALCHRICTIIENSIFRNAQTLKLTRSITQKRDSVHYPARNLFGSNRPQLSIQEDPGLSRFQHDVLMLPKYNGPPGPVHIGTLLSNVRHLVAFTFSNKQCSAEQLTNLYLELLPSWSDSLVSFTLICEEVGSRNAYDQLCEATAQLVSLRELHLLNILCWTPPFELMAPTLARLEQFTLHRLLFHCWKGIDLRHLSPRLFHFRLYVERWFFKRIRGDPLASLCPHFGSNLIRLSFGSDTFRTEALERLDALTYLDLTTVRNNEFCKIVKPDLFVELSRKVSLVELRLNIVMMRKYFRGHTKRDPNYPGIQSPIPQLTTVRCLHLRGSESNFCTNSKPKLNFNPKWYALLGRMFPALHTLNIIKYCTKQECLPEAPQDGVTSFAAKMEQLFAPHFDMGSHGQVDFRVDFELNRNVLHYSRLPNMDKDDVFRYETQKRKFRKEIRTSQNSHKTHKQ